MLFERGHGLPSAINANPNPAKAAAIHRHFSVFAVAKQPHLVPDCVFTGGLFKWVFIHS
jgi:hypothetical protein